jgi:hypothetical protein
MSSKNVAELFMVNMDPLEMEFRLDANLELGGWSSI